METTATDGAGRLGVCLVQCTGMIRSDINGDWCGRFRLYGSSESDQFDALLYLLYLYTLLVLSNSVKAVTVMEHSCPVGPLLSRLTRLHLNLWATSGDDGNRKRLY